LIREYNALSMQRKIRQLIRDGYNLIGQKYAEDRATFGSEKYIRQLMKRVRPGGTILDIGCGDGVPIDRALIKQGYRVVGIDIAENQVKRARRNCPEGEFEERDLGELKQGEYQVDGVVCMYTMFHISREEQGERIRVIGTYLPKGGILLVSMGDKEFEGVTMFHGIPMWWSQWGPKRNRELVEKAGFDVLIDEIDQTGGERHQVILARKR